MGHYQIRCFLCKKLTSINAIILLVVIVISCQSKYQKFQEQAPKADKVTIIFYQDENGKEDYQGLKIKADSSARIEQIVSYVNDSVVELTKCSPVGHIIFSNRKGQSLFDLPFCFVDGSAYWQFGANKYRPISDSGHKFLQDHYQTFKAVHSPQ